MKLTLKYSRHEIYFKENQSNFRVFITNAINVMPINDVVVGSGMANYGGRNLIWEKYFFKIIINKKFIWKWKKFIYLFIIRYNDGEGHQELKESKSWWFNLMTI